MKPVYSRIILPLKALVEGEFFNEYIKRGMSTPCLWESIHAHVSEGNVLMLSEGRVDVDNVYSLREGMESYSRFI